MDCLGEIHHALICPNIQVLKVSIERNKSHDDADDILILLRA